MVDGVTIDVETVTPSAAKPGNFLSKARSSDLCPTKDKESKLRNQYFVTKRTYFFVQSQK